MADSQDFQPRKVMAIVAGLLGFSGAVLIDAVLFRPVPVWLSTFFVVITTLVAVGLGHWGGRANTDTTRFVVGTLMAGLVNGVTLGAFAACFALNLAGLGFVVVGAVMGVVFAIPFAPALAVTHAAGQRRGRARPGSIVDAADRRAPWTATCLTVLTSASAVFLMWPGAVTPTTIALVTVASIGALGTALHTLAHWAEEHGLERRAVAAPEEAAEIEEDERGSVEVVDFGLGNIVRADRIRGDAYRSKTRTRALFRGDPQLARRILIRDYAMSFTAVVIALSLDMWLVMRPAAPTVPPILW
ncbi:MAG: hypothetical protein KC731_20885 [Myxococcales bacterium]|nr:hypothetical protein [Myxococcales bacterium]